MTSAMFLILMGNTPFTRSNQRQTLRFLMSRVEELGQQLIILFCEIKADNFDAIGDHALDQLDGKVAFSDSKNPQHRRVVCNGTGHIEADAKAGIGKMADGFGSYCRALSFQQEDWSINSWKPLYRHELARISIPSADLPGFCARIAIGVLFLNDILARQAFNYLENDTEIPNPRLDQPPFGETACLAPNVWATDLGFFY
jgi:hypothetical protein